MKDDHEWEYYNEFIRFRYIEETDDFSSRNDYYFEVYRKRWYRPWRKWEHSITTSNYQWGWFHSYRIIDKKNF